MLVFKLERERPAFASHGTMLYYIKDRYIRCYDFSTQRDNPLVAIRRNPSAAYNQGGFAQRRMGGRAMWVGGQVGGREVSGHAAGFVGVAGGQSVAYRVFK
jgi:hypothetical protein